jgi:hypothetical protein
MKRYFLLLLVTFLACMGTVAVTHAAEPAEAKSRMRERVPKIDELKLAGAIGENNRGFIEVRQSAGDAAAVVDAENRDRTTVFADTASRAGSTADAVGKAFARQIAAASAPGVWLQREDGTWYKK